jgi:hypothetical protein
VQFSEEVSRDELEAALAASGIKVTRAANRNKADIALTLAPVLERGPKARREWALNLGEEPAAGEQVELLLDKGSVMDGFLKPLGLSGFLCAGRFGALGGGGQDLRLAPPPGRRRRPGAAPSATR